MTWLRPALASLALVCAASLGLTAHAQRDPIATNEIAFVDFDLTIPSWDYGYFYSDGSIGGSYAQDRYFSDPPDYTNNVFRYTFDSTVFEGFSSWWGTGFGMPVNWINDPAAFISVDPADYILSFDTRVEGLTPEQTTGNCTMEFRLGTGGTDWVMVKALPYQPGSNWTHYVFHLDEGSWIAADGTQSSLEKFTNAVIAGTITLVQFNQNQDKPTAFGPDADNAILMDNIKLEVLQYSGPPPPPPPQVALAVLDYNFDDKDTWWAWPNFPETNSGWSANDNKATYSALRPDVGAGVGGSHAFSITMDNSTILTDPPGTPAWAGGNASTGGAGDYSLLTSSDRKDYRYNFAARVEGLAEGQETTPVIVQMSFNAPDDTLQPADSDTDRDLLLRLNLNVSNIKSNWQTFIVSLNDSTVDAGSLANFQAHSAKVDEIQWQLQIQNPHQANIWGTDADNKIVVDDFKFERLSIGTPPLKAQKVGDNVVITWDAPSTGTVKLLSGTSPSSVTNEVVGATSPHNSPATGTSVFFRTLWVPPPQ